MRKLTVFLSLVGAINFANSEINKFKGEAILEESSISLPSEANWKQSRFKVRQY